MVSNITPKVAVVRANARREPGSQSLVK